MAVRKAPQSVANAGEGSAFLELVRAYNDLQERFEALLGKLDTDAGVTDTDYESGIGVGDTLELT